MHPTRAPLLTSLFCIPNVKIKRARSFKTLALFIQLLSPLRKLTYFIKLVILDDIFIFRNSLMPGHQLVSKNENIAKRDFFDCVSFRSGLTFTVLDHLG